MTLSICSTQVLVQEDVNFFGFPFKQQEKIDYFEQEIDYFEQEIRFLLAISWCGQPWPLQRVVLYLVAPTD